MNRIQRQYERVFANGGLSVSSICVIMALKPFWAVSRAISKHSTVMVGVGRLRLVFNNVLTVACATTLPKAAANCSSTAFSRSASRRSAGQGHFSTSDPVSAFSGLRVVLR